MSKNLSAAETYAIHLNNNDATYFAQIPAIIFHATYIIEEQGVKIRKKLSPYAITLYNLIKQIAGTGGVVWSSRDYLASMAGMSAGSISNAKWELTQPIEQMGGKCFLEIIECKKTFKRNDEKKGATKYHKITPTHIWPENNAYMATIKDQKTLPLGPVHNSYTPSPHDSAYDTPSPHDSAFPGTPSPHDTNNNPYRNNSSVNETEPAHACNCDPNEKISVSPREEHERLKLEAESNMRKFGCDQNFINEMITKYTPDQILKAGYYTEKQGILGKIKKCKFGYLRNAIENKREWRT